TAILGILKIGSAYVPCDPNYPDERLTWMMEDAGVRLVMTERKLCERLKHEDLVTVCIEELEKESEGVEEPSVVRVEPENTAYVIYTSGSMGRPKGAMVTHGGAVNCIKWMQQRYKLNEGDRFLHKTSLNFDPSVWEIFWTLSVGG